MSFKYINPGYANLLDVDGGVTVEDSMKSRTGVGFYQPVKDKGINIPAMQGGFYCKFDLYIPAYSNGTIAVSVKNSNKGKYHGVTMESYYGGVSFDCAVNGVQAEARFIEWEKIIEQANIRTNKMNTFCFFVKSHDKTGSVKLIINGKTYFRKEDSFVAETEEGQACFYSKNENGLLSNLIISDEEIDMHEQVVAIPIVATETDMASLDGGVYRAETPNQKLLSSVDVSSLISAYGPLSKVTGIAIAGNPASKTDESMIKLTGLSVKDGQETERGTKEPRADKTAGVADCFPADMTLADLSGMKFGWKASV